MSDKQQILIVDDRPERLAALRQVLIDVDAGIVEAGNGEEALAAARDHHFAVAIFDVRTPERSGYEFAEHLRAHERTRTIPLVLLTNTSADEQHMFRGHAWGDVDYIVKPYAPEVLRRKVEVLLDVDRDRQELRRNRDRVDTLVAQRTARLGERIAAIECRYSVSRLVAEPHESIDDSLRAAVNLIPPGLRHSEIVCARITLDGREFATADFRETEWKQSADIVVAREVLGRVDVCYLQATPASDGEWFIEQERELIDNIARQIGVMFRRGREVRDLSVSRDRLLLAQRVARMGFLEWDLTNDSITWSDQVYRMYGVERGDAPPTLQETVRLVHPEDRKRARQSLERAVAGEAEHDLEHRILRPDGKVIWVHARAGRAPGPEGRPEIMLGTVVDITERKRAEEALRESEQRFRDLYENAPNAYWAVGVDGRIRTCNRRAGELLGYTVDELVGRRVLDLYADTPRGKEKAASVLERFQAGEEVRDQELQMRRADGRSFWISLTVNIVRDAEGRIVESRSMGIDITERKRAEDRLRAVVDTATDGIITIDRRGLIVAWNNAAQVAFGYSADEVIGRPMELLMPQRYREDYQSGLLRVAAGGARRVIGTTVELFGLRKDGSEFPLELSLATWQSGESVFFTGVLRDITRRKQVEEERERLPC